MYMRDVTIRLAGSCHLPPGVRGLRVHLAMDHATCLLLHQVRSNTTGRLESCESSSSRNVLRRHAPRRVPLSAAPDSNCPRPHVAVPRPSGGFGTCRIWHLQSDQQSYPGKLLVVHRHRRHLLGHFHLCRRHPRGAMRVPAARRVCVLIGHG